MKLICSLLILSFGLMAQQSTPRQVNFVPTNPSGACLSSYLPWRYSVATAGIFSCFGGSWTQINGSGGGGLNIPSSSGFVVSTGAGATVGRTFISGSGILIDDPDGLAAAPTFRINYSIIPGLNVPNVYSNENDFSTGSVVLPTINLTCATNSSHATTYTCTTSGVTFDSLGAGTWMFWNVGSTSCTGGVSTTINPDARGAKRVYKYDGTTDPASTDCAANRILLLAYDTTLTSGAGGWRIIGGVPSSSGGSSSYSSAISNASVVTNDGTDKVVATFSSVPSFPSNTCLSLSFIIRGSDATTSTQKIKVDGTTVRQYSTAAGTGAIINQQLKYCNSGAQNVQYFSANFAGYASNIGDGNYWIGYYSPNGAGAADANIDWSTSHTITFTTNAASGDAKVYVAEVKQ